MKVLWSRILLSLHYVLTILKRIMAGLKDSKKWRDMILSLFVPSESIFGRLGAAKMNQDSFNELSKGHKIDRSVLVFSNLNIVVADLGIFVQELLESRTLFLFG